MKTLFADIEATFTEGGDWCSLEKAQTIAALVVGLRPKLIVEIGVWMGGSAIPMLLALKHNALHSSARGRLVAIDPWSAEASKAGEHPENVAWWGAIDHERAYQTFCSRLGKHGVLPFCEIDRKRSDDGHPPLRVDLLHVDGNHSDQAVRDVERYAPEVVAGGILILDDVKWIGDHVSRALDLAERLGFAQMYPLSTGIVMQRQIGGAR